MNRKEGSHLLVRHLKGALAQYGFQHIRENTFARDVPGGRALLSFSENVRVKGEYRFSFGIGIRFHDVERLLDPETEDDLFPTVGQPLSILMGGGHKEWCFHDEKHLNELVPLVLADLRRYALPFVERYSSVTEVRQALEEGEPSRWFGLGPERRVATLAAMDRLSGKGAEALHRIDRP